LLGGYNRDYDPRTGRYLQSDPIGLQGDINTFSYSRNSPIDLFDKYGKFPECAFAGNCNNEDVCDWMHGQCCSSPESCESLRRWNAIEKAADECRECKADCVADFLFGADSPCLGEAYTQIGEKSVKSVAKKVASGLLSGAIVVGKKILIPLQVCGVVTMVDCIGSCSGK